MREIVHLQAGQCGNQIGAKVSRYLKAIIYCIYNVKYIHSRSYANHRSNKLVSGFKVLI